MSRKHRGDGDRSRIAGDVDAIRVVAAPLIVEMAGLLDSSTEDESTDARGHRAARDVAADHIARKSDKEEALLRADG